ncbi:MAG: Type 1 glutamine amidotransferase-like domain-containing protein [Clostridiales bacterium]|nr:Type 1 glutamine amidotransferase-like domain-containing protein [Clostridiales bacterium]
MAEKTVFLTSWLGGCIKVEGKRHPSVLAEANGLLNRIREYWKPESRVLMLCASPDDHEKNDDVFSCFRRALPMSGLTCSRVVMCDDRNEQEAERIDETDVIILTGGHVPTQNVFFKKIRLREKLSDFEGLVLAWSAGSMNCAETVYAGPELPGESIDPDFQRWISGLGLTKVQIYPHFQSLRNEYLDGKRLIDDITFDDSVGHEFIALNDGSYIVNDGSGEILYGEAYRIKDRTIEKICQDGDSIRL